MTTIKDETAASYDAGNGNNADIASVTADIFKQADEAARRMLASGVSVTSSNTAYEAIKQLFQHYQDEHFGVLWLDNQHCVIEFEELFAGTINTCPVQPRVVVRSALNKNAAACIFVHNHPSGCMTPSDGDIALTRRLANILNPLDVTVLDHIIVGRGEFRTFQW